VTLLFCLHIRHEKPVWHSLLEMLEHAGLSSRHADRKRLATSVTHRVTGLRSDDPECRAR